ncbi:MAG: HAD family hydrolase [Lentisphaerae bacterium]|nr:HAD family hydrolase [Lentisphaerota bacterium]
MLEIVCPIHNSVENAEVVNTFEPRKITHVFHDIDGTHSLIRDWPPVMALVNGAIARYGMFPGDARQIADAIAQHRGEVFEEAYRFAIESAGLSALTQMEWALRMARRLNNSSSEINEKIIAAIWRGEELFEDSGESAEELELMQQQATELFRAYEILLLEMCRDKNLAAARIDPTAWQVPGSVDFMQFLHRNGVKNYFVTGAVVEHDEAGQPRGTMAEEVLTLGYPIGEGKLIERFCGSTWTEKLPKVDIMRKLCIQDNIKPENLLVIGDGRSEVAAGVELGAIIISRLDPEQKRAREIHREIGTHLILPDYLHARKLFAVK